MHSNPNQEARALVKAEDGKQALAIGGRVFSPHQFDDAIPDFSSRQYLFLNAYRLGVSIEDACEKAGLSVDQADRFLARQDVIGWLKDRALKDHIKREWEEPGKWYQMGNDKLEGRRKMDKADTVIWQEFGKRVAPCKGDSHGNQTKIEINIDPKAVRDAFIRQDAIEGELA